ERRGGRLHDRPHRLDPAGRPRRAPRRRVQPAARRGRPRGPLRAHRALRGVAPVRRAARLAAIAAGALVPGLAAACATLALQAAWLREPPPGASVTAAYGRLRNTGEETLRVDGVASPRFGSAMFHETVHEGDRARMEH